MGHRGPRASCNCGICFICKNRENQKRYYDKHIRGKIKEKKRPERSRKKDES